MNQLTKKQYDWINRFIELTGDGVNQINLDEFTEGKITWEEFMAAEIQSWRNWQDEVYKQIQWLWEE